MDLATLERVMNEYPKIAEDIKIVVQGKTQMWLSFCPRSDTQSYENDERGFEDRTIDYNIVTYDETKLRELLEEYRIYLNFGKRNFEEVV